jgi:RNA polymerase sigma-70 factor (ECF subfamily)
MPVTAGGRTRADELALVRQAKRGDEGAFGELVGAHRAELRAYCYRMLGSVHDAEDALQDALLRAWRGLPRFEGRSSVRSWLYSIATNTALDITRHRSRRELPVDFGPAARPGSELGDPPADVLWLEPFPDLWLTAGAPASPEARYEQRESVELAFVVALQRLPPLQRAVLILRDVLGFAAAEVAAQLSTSVPAGNSALQRARATVRSSLPARSQQAVLAALGDQRTRDIVRRYSDALERGDADALIGMLTQDATWSMPPVPTWFTGHDSLRRWLVRDPLSRRWQHQPTGANGQLALGCYLWDAARRRYTAAVIDVLTLDGDKISAVTAFLAQEDGLPPMAPPPGQPRPGQPRLTGAELFAGFGLPAFLG